MMSPCLTQEVGWGRMERKNMRKKLEQTHNLKSRAHSVSSIYYHIIQCVKYRKRVLCFPEINYQLEDRVRHICAKWNVDLIAFGTDKNHFHILIGLNSDVPIEKFIGNLKSSTSKYLRNRYPFLKKAIPTHLWSPSYCIIATGNVALPIVKSYVNNQGVDKK